MEENKGSKCLHYIGYNIHKYSPNSLSHYKVTEPRRGLQVGKFEADFRQPLTFLAVGIVVLNIVLEVRISHSPNLERGRIKNHHVVRETGMQVKQRMSLDIERALRHDPFLELHPVLIDDAIEVDTRPTLVFSQCIQTVQRSIPSQYNPLIAGASIVVEHFVYGISELRLGRGRRKDCDHVWSILRQHVEESTAGTHRLAIRTSRLVPFTEDRGKFQCDRVIEHLALLVVLHRVACTSLGIGRSVSDLVDSLEDLDEVVKLRRISRGSGRCPGTFLEYVPDFRQVCSYSNPCSRRPELPPFEHNSRSIRHRASHDHFMIVGRS